MREKSLDQLIASLKTEAVEAAEKEAAEILEAARLKADQLVAAAEKKREIILREASQEAEATLEKGNSALRQAARDVGVTVRNDLIRLLEAVLEKEVRRAFTPGLVKSAIVQILENLGSKVELKLSPEFSEELAGYLHQHLQTTDHPPSITTDTQLDSGFSITHTAEGWSYAVTPEAVAAALREHLTGNWMAVLSNEAKK